MAFTVHGQRGRAGQEWARQSLFGVDYPSRTPAAQFRDALVTRAVQVATALEDTGNHVQTHAVPAEALGATLKEVAHDLREQARALRTLAAETQQLSADRPFRVVLMGRTMAGKSTLFEYFSGGDGARVGDGRQRYSRDACARMSEVLGFEIVDTPGVGAMDGEDDFQVAFAQVVDADLILWIASDQATQEQTGRALRHLGALGKPIVVALNCLADLDDPIALIDLLEEPERVFGGDAQDNLHPIERHLGQAGTRFIRAVPLHAQAALRSQNILCEPDERRILEANSRVGDLVAVLHAERDRTAAQRRAVSICDRTRTALLSMAGRTYDMTLALHRQVEAHRGGQRDFDRRATRAIDDAQEKLLAAVTDMTTDRERWVENVDIEDNIDKLWKAEAEEMQAELTKRGSAIGDELRRSIESLSTELAEDWAVFTPGTFVGLSGYGTAWINRAAKVGGRLTAGAGTGAGIGFAVGSIVPGAGNVAGAAIGAGIGLVAGVLSAPFFKVYDSLMDRFFRSKSAVRERRRDQVRSQLLPIIEAIRAETTDKVNAFVTEWRRTLQTELTDQARQASEVEAATARVADIGRAIEAAIGDIDRETCRELLRLCGRTRAATAVARATRWQGVGIAADLHGRSFSELALFPVADAVELIVPVAPSTFPPADALQVVMGLSAATISVTTMSRERLDAVVWEALPGGVIEAWQSLAHTHTRVTVDLSI
jgi:small GTP-binding protein